MLLKSKLNTEMNIDFFWSSKEVSNILITEEKNYSYQSVWKREI